MRDKFALKILAISIAFAMVASGIVRDGTYVENVDANQRLTIRSEDGSDLTIVHAADPNDHVFEVTADYVSGLTVKEEITFIR